MSRSTLALAVLLALIGAIALSGCVAEAGSTAPEPPVKRLAPAPIDAAVPKNLSTATFGLG
jgi:hypothetical protein